MLPKIAARRRVEGDSLRSAVAMRHWVLGGALVAALLSTSCLGGVAGRYSREQLDESLKKGDAGLVLGVFPLRPHGVVDGDTVKVGGLDASLRLLGMDTEETFKNEKDRRAYEKGWEYYLKWKASQTNRPVKVATPLGEEAKKWAKHFFEGVYEVRLERDHPKEIRGVYGRYLVYVFAKKKGKWVNYNVEAVRAGMSPYFAKYGFSRRFHADFVEAQQEAQGAKVGIWDPKKRHYYDYEARLKWWNARGEFVRKFEKMAKGRDDFIPITNWDAERRLRDHLGDEVSVLSTIGSIKKRVKKRGPSIVKLARSRTNYIPVVFFDPFVLEDSKIERAKGEFAIIRGKVQEYQNPYNGKKKLQIVVKTPQAVTIPTYTPPDSSGTLGEVGAAGPAAAVEASPEQGPGAATRKTGGKTDLDSPTEDSESRTQDGDTDEQDLRRK